MITFSSVETIFSSRDSSIAVFTFQAMPMKVLLVSANTEMINMPVLPLGMACIASAAEKRGHQVSHLNLMSEPDALMGLVDRIEQFRPEIIGISVRNIDDQVSSQPRFLLEPIKAVVSTCKAHSQSTLVIGGAGYSIFPLEALEYLDVDWGIQGPGEYPFILMLDRLSQGGDLADIPGFHSRRLGIANPPAARTNMDTYPLPPPDKSIWSLKPTNGQPIWVPFQTRRGCPMNCIYCSTAAIEGRLIHKRDLDHAISSLTAFSHAGFDHLFFVDNTFNLPVTYAKALCERIIGAGLHIRWRAIIYPWKIDEALVTKMARSGCSEVSLGLESGSNRMLKTMGKKFRRTDIRHAADLFKSQGIRRMGFLLLGGPGESKESVAESLAFTDALNLDLVKVTIGPRIYPHTDLARHARRTGKIKTDDPLLFPRFYIENGMEAWLRETVAAWVKNHPNWLY
jgi:radical SAM superfamily enzyme YgiQ (UPF0313 family)